MHDKWKNHKAPSPTNQTPMDESGEKSITKKNVIKKMSLRIKLFLKEKKLEGRIKINIRVLIEKKKEK